MSEKIFVPQLNPNDPEVELSHWHKGTGEQVKKGDLLCDFTTSKAVYQHESPREGFLAQAAPRGSRLRSGALLGLICATEKEAISANMGAGESNSTTKIMGAIFSKNAQAKLKELGLSEALFAGQEFVTEKMVLAQSGKHTASALSMAKEREISTIAQAYGNVLRSSLSVQLEAGPLLERIDQDAISREAHIAYSVAQILKKNPRFLLRFGEQNPAPKVDIGYALDLGTGVRLMHAERADSWSREKWTEQLTDWSLRLMRNEIRHDELAPGRFAITDLSSLGVLYFEPLLVSDQSAILGVGGDIEASTPLLTFTLAFDHRVHDGRQAAEFLRELKIKLL